MCYVQLFLLIFGFYYLFRALIVFYNFNIFIYPGEIVSKLVQLSSLKTTIVIEFHHHMEAFCNGMDVYIFLQIDQNANLFILNDMEINISFISVRNFVFSFL